MKFKSNLQKMFVISLMSTMTYWTFLHKFIYKTRIKINILWLHQDKILKQKMKEERRGDN